MTLNSTPAERLSKGLVRRSNGCLEWTGHTDPKGYGKITINYQSWRTHRLAWTLNRGPIPDGLHVLHHCDNPPCCETEGDDHLFLGTHVDNMADRDAKGRGYNQQKTHCPQGHEYTEANTYFYPNGNRGCRTCHVEHERAFRRKDGPVEVVNKDKTHCKNGHPFDEANTRVSLRDGVGPERRTCRACGRDAQKAKRARDYKNPY